MKPSAYITETTEQELELNSLASLLEVVLFRVLTNPLSQISLESDTGKHLTTGEALEYDVGVLGDNITDEGLGSLVKYLKDLKIIAIVIEESHQYDIGISGAFSSEDFSVSIVCPIVIRSRPEYYNTIMGIPAFVPGQLHSTIVHELRHALDDKISNGKALHRRAHSLHSTPTEFELEQGEMAEQKAEYLRWHTEINARASQAFSYVGGNVGDRVMSGEDISNEDLTKFILLALDGHLLVHIYKSNNPEVYNKKYLTEPRPLAAYPLDNPKFKKLIKRSYLFARKIQQDAQKLLSEE